MNFVTWSIRNPVPVIMMFLALIVGGLWGFRQLPVQDLPDISAPFVVVSVGYAGTPPSQMETEITRKVEDAVSTLVGIKRISSTINKAAHRSSSSSSRRTCPRPWMTCAMP
jgi:multidrug efflux pump subunit AcrB